MNKDKCFHITCNSDELCKPTKMDENFKIRDQVAMMLVKPTDEDSWSDILQPQGWFYCIVWF